MAMCVKFVCRKTGEVVETVFQGADTFNDFRDRTAKIAEKYPRADFNMFHDTAPNSKGKVDSKTESDTAHTVEEIAAKIQKLFALAGNNPSEDEAQAAALKAQELMAKYNIELSQLSGRKIEYVMAYASYKQKKRQPYNATLGGIIAVNFRCRGIVAGGTVGFFGEKQDADAAKAVFEYLYHEMYKGADRIARNLAKQGVPRNGQCRSYTHGFLIGLKTSLEEQSQALMVIVPEEVSLKFKESNPNLKVHKNRQGAVTDNELFQQGIIDGKSSMKKRQIEK